MNLRFANCELRALWRGHHDRSSQGRLIPPRRSGLKAALLSAGAWKIDSGQHKSFDSCTSSGNSELFRAVWLVILIALGARGGELNLCWNPSTSVDAIGYDIYYGGASGYYTNKVDVGSATNCTISGLSAGATYYFAALDYDSLGDESEFSNEISYAVPFVLTAPVLSIANVAIPDATSLTSVPVLTTADLTGQWTNEALICISVTNAPALMRTAVGTLSISRRAGTIALGVPVTVTFTYTNMAASNKFWRAGTIITN